MSRYLSSCEFALHLPNAQRFSEFIGQPVDEIMRRDRVLVLLEIALQELFIMIDEDLVKGCCGETEAFA